VAADHTRSFRFRADGGSGPDVICDTRAIPVPRPSPTAATDKPTREPIVVTIGELEDIARTLDEEDARDSARVPRNFLTRLKSVEGNAVFSVLSPKGDELAPNSAISLDGVSHMIGLPGSGKSTLIFLLVVLLARQGRRVTLLVPSIEFALALDADLARYSIPTALLVGQSPDARKSHATRLAERIATLDSGGLPPSIPPPVPPARFGWTETGKSLLDRIRRVAIATKRPEGNELPYADLRAALQVRVPGLVLLESWIFPRDEGAPLFAANGSPAEVKAAAHRATSAWCQLTLRPWVERLGTDCGDVDVFEEKALKGDLFEDRASPALPLDGQVPDALRSDFHDFADILLSIAAPALEGAELFPSLGPVHRVIDREYGNTISFETWPSTLPGGEDLFSMVAAISVETRPSSRLPYLVVRAAKRIWCNEFPAASQLYGRRRISVRAVLRGPSVRAATLSVRLEKGIPHPNLDALLFEAGRASGESFTEDLPELVKTRGLMPNLFVGVPFRYGYRPAPKIQFGVTLQDQVDLTRAIKERISKFGFEDSRLRVLDPATNRPEEFYQQANLYNLITHHFGQVPGEELPIRVEELFGSPEKKPRGRPRPIKTVDLEPIVRANQERLDKAFGKQAEINLMFICRREAEEGIFRSVVGLLFGDRVKVVRHAIPEGVHGTRKALDGGANLNRTQRAGLRKAAWTNLAKQIRDDFPNSPVIVQAARKYDGFEEDQVNKDVGRNTLATVAGCNVQYLLPPGGGNAAEYMHRVQAALYDLLFGHAGLGPVPAGLVSSTFEGPNNPRSIVGISVVSQGASRTGRPDGAALAVAMKIDVSTGRIFGRIGHLRNAGFDIGKFQTLSRTLVDVASAGRTSLGEKLQDRRKNFLSFVRGVVDEIASDDPNSLVLLESTTSRSLWSWLSDENISSEIYLEDFTSRPPVSWKGLRFVRVREKSAGRLAVETQRKWTPVTRQGEPRRAATIDEVYATAVERLVESPRCCAAKASRSNAPRWRSGWAMRQPSSSRCIFGCGNSFWARPRSRSTRRWHRCSIPAVDAPRRDTSGRSPATIGPEAEPIPPPSPTPMRRAAAPSTD
jgi:hypothetical protein